VLFGVIDLETRITRGEHDLLNPVAVNCIRAFPGRGIRVWGARTLSSDPGVESNHRTWREERTASIQAF
jgi:phage tail sheath protein FI